MPKPKDVYIKCDELENIPKPNMDNWLFEIELLSEELGANSKVLQVGCMDGKRIITLLDARTDLLITGLDIEKEMVDIAKDNLAKAEINAELIHGDITNPPQLGPFDYVICLNNTLGYIPDEEKAVENMKKLGETAIISVYGEKFNDELAHEYFSSINLEISTIENDRFHMKDFTTVKRYRRQEVENWGGRIIETPIGYFCVIGNNLLSKSP